MFHQFRQEPHAVHAQAEAAIALCTEQGFAYYLAWGTTMLGWAQVMQGQDTEGLAQMRKGLAALRATGAALRLPYYLALLAEACGQTGQATELTFRTLRHNSEAFLGDLRKGRLRAVRILAI